MQSHSIKKKNHNPLETSISQLTLEKKTIGLLSSIGIRNVADLLRFSWMDLIDLNIGIGPMNVTKIERCLASLGMELRMEFARDCVLRYHNVKALHNAYIEDTGELLGLYRYLKSPWKYSRIRGVGAAGKREMLNFLEKKGVDEEEAVDEVETTADGSIYDECWLDYAPAEEWRKMGYEPIDSNAGVWLKDEDGLSRRCYHKGMMKKVAETRIWEYEKRTAIRTKYRECDRRRLYKMKPDCKVFARWKGLLRTGCSVGIDDVLSRVYISGEGSIIRIYGTRVDPCLNYATRHDMDWVIESKWRDWQHEQIRIHQRKEEEKRERVIREEREAMQREKEAMQKERKTWEEKTLKTLMTYRERLAWHLHQEQKRKKKEEEERVERERLECQKQKEKEEMERKDREYKSAIEIQSEGLYEHYKIMTKLENLKKRRKDLTWLMVVVIPFANMIVYALASFAASHKNCFSEPWYDNFEIKICAAMLVFFTFCGLLASAIVIIKLVETRLCIRELKNIR